MQNQVNLTSYFVKVKFAAFLCDSTSSSRKMTNSFIFMHSWVNVAVVHNVSCIFLPYMQLPRYFLAFPLNDFPRDLDLQILFFFHVSSRERGQMWHFDIAHIPFDIFRQFVTKPDHYQEFLLKADWLSFIHIV